MFVLVHEATASLESTQVSVVEASKVHAFMEGRHKGSMKMVFWLLASSRENVALFQRVGLWHVFVEYSGSTVRLKIFGQPLKA